MRHPHKWEELLPEEFNAEFARSPIVYLPIGAMEEHGIHNPLAVDPWTAREVCLRAAAGAGGIVHPVIPLAPAGHPAISREELRSKSIYLYPPSLWVSRELCREIYVELLESLADLGCKACVAVSGHWPGEVLLDRLAQELGGVVNGMPFYGGGVVDLLKRVWPEKQAGDPGLFGHGLMWETSCMLAIREEWVDMARVPGIRDSAFRSQLQLAGDRDRARVSEATAAFGNRFLDDAGAELARIARALPGRTDATTPG